MKTISFLLSIVTPVKEPGYTLACFCFFCLPWGFHLLGQIHLHNCQDTNTSPNNTRKVLSLISTLQVEQRKHKDVRRNAARKDLPQSIVLLLLPQNASLLQTYWYTAGKYSPEEMENQPRPFRRALLHLDTFGRSQIFSCSACVSPHLIFVLFLHFCITVQDDE